MTEQAEPYGGTDAGPVWYSVPLAAAALGISERGIRKRIAAGTLIGRRDGTRWTVQLPGPERVPERVPEPEPNRAGETSTASRNTLYRQPEQGRADLELVMEQFILPLVEKIAQVERENGILTATTETQGARIAGLEAELAGFRAVAVQSHSPAHSGPDSGSWWGWLRARLSAAAGVVV